MDKEKILALADHIENLSARSQMGFDMSQWCYSTDDEGKCKTVGCIAGHAVAKWNPKLWSGIVSGAYASVESVRIARDILGLDRDTARDLFEPYYILSRYRMDDVSTKMAADVLRHLAKTGEVEWPEEPY